MARKTRLLDFQAYLAERLGAAAQGGRAAGWLAFVAGDRQWLVDLADSGEVIQVPPLFSVPLTQPWFAGVANIRGNLFAVSDFGAFCGGSATPRTPQARLLLVGARQGSNAALLVPQLLGLRQPADFTPQGDDTTLPVWGQATLVDAAGGAWHKLSVRALLADQRFMTIGA